MRNPQQMSIAFNSHPRLPWIAPGATVTFGERRRRRCLSGGDRRGPELLEIALVRPEVRRRPQSRHDGWRPPERRRRVAAPDVPEATRRLRGRVCAATRSGPRAPGVAQCRLTAFVYPQVVVDRLVRRLSRGELRQIRRAILGRAPDRYLKRDAYLYLLLRLHVCRASGGRPRRHPELSAAWAEFANAERRRMRRRLRSALRRLNRIRRFAE